MSDARSDTPLPFPLLLMTPPAASIPPTAAERRAWWPWSLAGAAVGFVIALGVLGLGCQSGEHEEGVVYLTLVCTAPTGQVLAPCLMSLELWWLFVLACWPVQGLLLGSFVGFSGRGGQWSRPKCWLILLALSIGVPFGLAVLFHFAGP